jgi:hypothetical protein
MSLTARPPRALRRIALASFALAFVLRLAWIAWVQSPFDSVYSDMAGYVDRAERLLWNIPMDEPRLLTLFPPGAHTLMALEFFLLGRHSRTAISIVHALVGAVPAAFVPGLMYRLVPRRSAAAAAGLIVALWEPQICFVGFFSTEIWFSAAIAAHAWVTSRDRSRPRDLLASGVLAITAIVVRPQFLLTWALDLGGRSVLVYWRRGLRAAALAAVCLALPVGLGLAATSVRYHALAGRWGLISASGLNRVWADTDVCRVEASWKTAAGQDFGYWFSPPSKPALKPSDTVKFTGFIVDPDILDGIRRDRTRGVPLRDRIARKIGNVELLLVRNLPWPESNYGDRLPWLGASRVRLEEIFRDIVLYGVLPWCLVGLLLARRNRTTAIFAANFATVIVAAAFFFGEARYHVPYDPFAIVLALAGVYEVGWRLRRVGLRLLRRLRAA